MTIPRPISRSMISTAGWGIPMTDEVNALRIAVDANTAAIAAMQARKIVVAYAQTTTSVSFTTLTDIPGLAVTFTAIAGHRYRTTVYGYRMSNPTANNMAVVVSLLEGGTLLQSTQVQEVGVHQSGGGAYANLVYSSIPTAAAHTYKVAAARDSGTDTHTWYCSVGSPSFIMVEDIT